ncbi:ABC transporter substrate-binding protein [Leifsonia naganoensis]|uniref:Multiple sugar transport system substrate-binding protein n=1 Tax=Leifsonia naganoensis TaxID=150025 RepID=A0A853DNT8_9MICO|nr:extracellular solute-binding protein [Leifsonia naganoensis]NYK09283.1 multiple sugar transport system substrate-binding protein [Leifsonia naganoensis]
MHTKPRSAALRTLGVLATVATAAVTLAGCSSSGDDASGKTVITLAGPNQWNNEAGTFGKPWEDLIARFEKAEPDIEVKTTVLPIASFSDTLSTQLSAGTAPELIFAQAPHTPEQIVSLDKYLAEPNPFVKGNTKWQDIFNPATFGDANRNVKGKLEFIPFNLVTAGLFYNEDALKKAGVTAPVESIGDLTKACTKLSDAGYSGLAMDNGSLGTGWTSETILNNLLAKYFDAWNKYDTAGNPGTADESLSQKSLARAVLTGELDATKTPEVAEAAKLLKDVYDNCATKNWSGTAASATFVGGQEFLAGKAATAWGTSFASTNLSDVKWGWSTMPFPTVTKDDTSLASGDGARFGASAGGTSYMIPATTKGKKLDAAVKFLQYVSSPEGGTQWIKDTDAIPATTGTEPSKAVANLTTGDWAKPSQIGVSALISKAEAGKNLWDGYLLGTKTLDQQLTFLESVWKDAAHEGVQAAGWTEDWTKN